MTAQHMLSSFFYKKNHKLFVRFGVIKKIILYLEKINTLSMRKISYILGFALLSVAFMACDKEPLDEEVINDEYKPGEQILRFELNGVTRIAKGSEIQASRAMDGSLGIQVNIKDELNDFQDISFTIASSDAVPGTYNTALINGFIPEDYGYSEASLNYAGDEWNWSYSTQYNEQDLSEIPDYLEDRKSTRLNSSHVKISYAVFCLKKKINK